MTCLTCGAMLESTETSCPVCAAPITPDASSAASRPSTSPRIEPPGSRPDTPALGPGTAATGSTSRAAGGAGAGDAGGPGGQGGAGSPGGPGGGRVGGGPAAPGWSATPGWSAAPSHPSGLSSEVRGWGIAAHLIGLGGALLTAVTLGFAGPLVIWLLKRDDHSFIDHHARESLNFQLTTLVALLIGTLAAIPIFLLGFLTFGVLWVVALVALLAATVVWFVFPIVGAVRAANGEGYRYPVSIRFVR